MRKGRVAAAVSAAMVMAGAACAADLGPMPVKAAPAAPCASVLDFYTTACQLHGVAYGTAPGESPNYLFDLRSVGADFGKTLASYGVYLHAVTQQSDLSVLSGGHDKRSQYLSVSYFGLSVDTEKAFGLQGGFFDFTASGELGNTLTGSNSVGSNGFVPYAFSNELRLVNFYYDQSFFNHAIDIAVGRMESGYTATPYSPGVHATEWQCVFFSRSCGDTDAFANDSSKAPYEVGSWAAKLTVHPAANWYVLTGVYENQPTEVLSDSNNGWPGRDWRFDQAMGAYLPLQVGYITTPETAMYPTNFHVGAYYDTAKFPDKLLNAQGQPIALMPGAPLMDQGTYGAYMAWQQTVWRPDPRSARRLSVFFSGDWDLSRKTEVAQQYYAGIMFNGPLPQRAADSLNILASVEFYDPNQVAARDLLAGIHRLDYTMKPQIGFEINYGFVPAPGITIYPFMQYIIHPDMLGLAIPDPNDKYALTAGLRLTTRFDTLFGLPSIPGF